MFNCEKFVETVLAQIPRFFHDYGADSQLKRKK